MGCWLVDGAAAFEDVITSMSYCRSSGSNRHRSGILRVPKLICLSQYYDLNQDHTARQPHSCVCSLKPSVDFHTK